MGQLSEGAGRVVRKEPAFQEVPFSRPQHSVIRQVYDAQSGVSLQIVKPLLQAFLWFLDCLVFCLLFLLRSLRPLSLGPSCGL